MKHPCLLKNTRVHDYIELLLKPQISLNVNVIELLYDGRLTGDNWSILRPCIFIQ